MEINFYALKTEGHQLFFYWTVPLYWERDIGVLQIPLLVLSSKKIPFFEFLFEYFASPYASEPWIKWL